MRHAAEEMMLHHRGMASPKEIDIVGTMDKTDMRDRMDKRLWIPNHTACNRIAPKLLRVFELLKDPQGPIDLDTPVGFTSRCVADLT